MEANVSNDVPFKGIIATATTTTTTTTAAVATTTTTLSMNQTVASKSVTNNKIKLCGYLKKKRNKVGGWRKLWFVLQDKLLLSYGSKEEYDNKLVSFKDVLNLVPGTMVRPLGGFRFTIETTSQAMYTFHCDDRLAYRDWMAMLLDSLATTPQTSCVQQKFPHKCFGHSYATSLSSINCGGVSAPIALATPTICSASVDSIPHALSQSLHKYSQPLSRRNFTMRSYDSINQVERNSMATPATIMTVKSMLTSTSTAPAAATTTATSKSSCVRIPIVQQTAKLLEPNGVNSSKQQQQQTTQELHMISNRKSLNHYDLAQRFVPTTTTTATTIFRLKAYESETADNMQQRFWPKTKTDFMKSYSKTTTTNSMFEHSIETVDSINGRDHAPTSSAHKAIDLMKDHIHRFNIKGTKEYTLDAFAQQQQQQQQQQRSSVNMTTRMEQVIIVQEKEKQQQLYKTEHNNNNNNCRGCKLEQAQKKHQQQQEHHFNEKEPIYAVVDLQHKYEQRRLRNSSGKFCNLQLAKRCNSYDSILQFRNNNGNAHNSDSGDLNKIEKLANSLEDDVDGIYEDGDNLFCQTAIAQFDQAQFVDANLDEENIYEPINITTSYAPQTNRAFWQYFKRLKVKPLLQFTRLSKRNQQPDYDVMQLPIASKTTNSTIALPIATSHFANIKYKFGRQRKSIRAHMRKLCVRAAYEPKPFCSGSANSTKAKNKATDVISVADDVDNVTPTPSPLAFGTHKNKFRNRWRTVKLRRPKNAVGVLPTTADNGGRTTRYFFGGSLPHLRKARVSLFADHQ